MGRPWTCIDCGASGIQNGRGGARKRCDPCRAGSGGPAPRRSEAGRPTGPWAVRRLAGRDGGPISAAVTGDIDALMTPHPMAEGLRELARLLAGRLDDCEEKYAAPLAREL